MTIKRNNSSNNNNGILLLSSTVALNLVRVVGGGILTTLILFLLFIGGMISFVALSTLLSSSTSSFRIGRNNDISFPPVAEALLSVWNTNHRHHSSKTKTMKTKTKTTSLFESSSTANNVVPYFATSNQQKLKEGRASITTRLPIGKLFDSRDYIFSTATNVRGYEWTMKETEELLDDLLDASNGLYSPIIIDDSDDNNGEGSSPIIDYELNQIVLIPMEWDKDLLGLGCRYDVYDGQQRLVTLCLLFAAMKECFEKMDSDETDVITELSDFLNPPKTRKAEILRIELNRRDNEILSQILKGDYEKVSKIKKDQKQSFEKMTKPNQQILNNFETLESRLQFLSKDELLKLLDFIIEKVYLLVCVPESPVIARNIVMGQGKGKDNEIIDDFKGLVCFRYIQDNEKAMYKTFDAWDTLSSTAIDIENGIVGRSTVSDACLLRATAFLGAKIGTRAQLFCLEQWLREDLIENECQGDDFFMRQIRPASITLGYFRDGSTPQFGLSKTGRKTKSNPSIEIRLRFLRNMIMGVPATKEVEMIILELLLRATGDHDKDAKPMPLADLESYLGGAEQLALYFAFVKPSSSQKYKKCFTLLDAIESNNQNFKDLLTEEEKLEFRNALFLNDLGATASGKRLAIAVLKRLNRNVLLQNDQELQIGEDEQVPAFLEPILPIKATKKAWGDVWSDKSKRDKWVHRFGNLCLVSNKAITREMKMSFDMKKQRYDNESSTWPLTSRLTSEHTIWDEEALVQNTALMVSLIESTWEVKSSSSEATTASTE